MKTTRICLVVKSVLMFTLNVCISVLCELIAADIRAKWSPLVPGIRGSRYKMARLLMTGEIGLSRNQSIKVYTEELLQIICGPPHCFSQMKMPEMMASIHIVDD